jgi:hypothetical protein
MSAHAKCANISLNCLDASLGPSEVRFVIGVITWVLTPLHRRERAYYLTRSRVALAMARIMRQLRFSVFESDIEINSVDVLNRLIRDSNAARDGTCVFLVTASDVKTDYDAAQAHSHGPEPSCKLHVVAIKQIPPILLSHVLHAPFNFTTQQH